jgi:hypothetical protein
MIKASKWERVLKGGGIRNKNHWIETPSKHPMITGSKWERVFKGGYKKEKPLNEKPPQNTPPWSRYQNETQAFKGGV